MADSDEKDLIGFDWKEPLYGEALSERTQKTGRNLVLVAVATLLVSVFEVSIKTFPTLSLDFSKHPAALEMFIAVINLGLLMAYGLRVSTDYLRAREDWADLVKFFEKRRVTVAFAEARQADGQIAQSQYDEPEWDPEPWFEPAIRAEADAKKRIAMLETRLGDRRIPRAMRHARLWLLGAGPLLIGFIAFVHTRGPVWAFFRAVVGMDR